MTDTLEVRKSVLDAIANIKARMRTPHDTFTADDVITIVDTKAGQKPVLDQVNAILRELWGHGIEPFSTDGVDWKFGSGKRDHFQPI